MDSARTFLRKISALFHRERFQDELAQEVAFHREQIAAQLREEGVPAKAAQAAASRQFGNELRIREKSVEGVEFRFETTLQDIPLWHSPVAEQSRICDYGDPDSRLRYRRHYGDLQRGKSDSVQITALSAS